MPLVDINAAAGIPIDDGVSEAWVVDAQSDPRARPYLMAVPGSLAELERRVAAHRASGGPAVVRICPDEHGYPLVPWALSLIPEYCTSEELGLVVDLMPRGGAYPWAEIVDFARAYPRLAVVAVAAPLAAPTAGRALDATANLILETSAADADGPTLAGLARTHGSYRLAYGSGRARGRSSVIAEDLPPADADAILAGTAAHLGGGTWSATYL